MANKKISDLPEATTLDGDTEIVVSGVSRRVKAWQGGWNWSINGDALPLSWPVGGYGYSSSDRYTFGNPNYAPARTRILRISSGTTENDFIIG